MKFTITIFILFHLIGTGVFAQLYGKNDSLLNVYKSLNPSEDKVKTINHLVNIYLYTEPGKAKAYIDEGYEMSMDLGFEKGINMLAYQRGVYFTNLPNYDSAIIAYDEALKYAILINDTRSRVRAMNGKAIVKLESGHYDECILLLEETIPLINKTNDTLTLAVTYSHFANAYKAKGFNKIALEYLHKSIKELTAINAEMRLADAFYMMGDLELNLKNYKDALQNYGKAGIIYDKLEDHYFITELLYSQASLAINQKNWNLATKLLDSTTLHAQKHGFDYIFGKVANSKAEVQIGMGNYKAALPLINESLNAAIKQQDMLDKANALVLKGKVLNLTGQSTASIAPLNEAFAYFDKNKVLGGLIYVLENRANSYESLGNYKQALADTEMCQMWRDSSANIEKTKQIEELRIIFDTEQKEAEIENLALEIDKSNLQKSLFAGGMFSAIAITGLLYFGFRQRSKRNKANFEQKQALVQKELDFKKKELVSQTLHLVNKNTLIQDLQNDLKVIRKSTTEHTKEIGKIIKDLQQENASDANWEVFKSHFAQVHNDFDLKLKKLAPDITDNEIRLAAFIKMKLSPKEIAGMLNVQAESVNKSKYRLKKKFNLDEGIDFDTFLDEV